MSRIIIILSFLIFPVNSIIYAQKYNFRNFSINEGLTQSEIYSICEDSRGNLWFGSLGGGIVKFDGYTFTSYREEDGLANNYVHAIYEDHTGNIWVGTEKGLCFFNGKSFVQHTNATGPGKNTIKCIIEDEHFNLWIGTDLQGLFLYKHNRFIEYTSESGLPSNTINCLTLNKQGVLWIGTKKGICKYQDNIFTKYKKEDGLVVDNIRGISCDNSGNIWTASSSAGVCRYDGSAFIKFTIDSGLPSNIVYSVFADHRNRIWFGTANGISMYNGSSFQNFNEGNGLASNVVLCIKEDSSNDLWFGTSGGGVSRLDNTRFTHFNENEKMGRQVFSVIQALNGKMIFATSSGGLTLFDGSTYSVLKGNGSFTSSKVKSLFYDSNGSLWIGTNNDGAYKFNDDGFHHLTIKDSLCSNSINGFAADTSKNLWLSSPDSGLCVITKYNTIKYFNDKNGLLSNTINSITSDHKGAVWVGTDKGLNSIRITGIDSMSVELSKFTHDEGIANFAVRSIVVDKNNNILIGTAGGGINIIKSDSIVNYDKKNGLCSNNIYSLLLDDDNNLWVGSELGIDRLTMNDHCNIVSSRHFGKNEGFTGIEVYKNASYKDNSGRLWFGTVNGATVYNPKEDIPFKTSPKTHITGIKLFYDNIENTKYGKNIQSWYPIPNSLILPHNKNSLTFQFVGIYQRNPESVRYKWKLEGLNSDWSPPLTQHEVTYSNLPPGTYTFMVKSCNEYNVWTTDAQKFEFQILAPFWQRWWFIILCIVSFVSSGIYLFYTRLRKIKEKNRIENEKLEMKMNIIELEQEAQRLQMNPHFIFNALNSIQGIISTNDIYGAKNYLVKFARLMRIILENAREKFVPLQNEIEMLENYMELERLCKNNKFSYTITVNTSVDTEKIEIPPMMIQPFIENAIKHGIQHKQGNGNIAISFTLVKSVLKCEITDDGIGRTEAAILKMNFQPKHKSTGMLITKKRLEQLEIQTGGHAGFEISDLKNSENQCVGTKVILSIPVEI